MSSENTESLLEYWRDVLHQKDNLKLGGKEDTKRLAIKQREVVRLETQINDKKNLIRILSQKMRYLKKLQLTDKLNQEKKKQQHVRQADEEWDSRFRSTRQSDFVAGRLEYDEEVENALEKLLGKEGLNGARKDGSGVYLKKSHHLEENKIDDGEEHQEEHEEEQQEEQPEELQEEDEEEKQAEPKEDEGNEEEIAEEEINHEGKNDHEKEQEAMNEEENNKEPVKLPLTKQPKPWELQGKAGKRSEILVGVRYNKDFECLFDDKSILKGRKPERIVRIVGHSNAQFIVGMQFTYMTSQEELIPCKLHGDKKVTLNSLEKVQYEIQYREKIVSITAHFSKGIHWMEFRTNEGRVLLFGKKVNNPKAVTMFCEIEQAKGEEVCYVSGGFTGKDNRFTYLAFHLSSAWDKPENHFDHPEDQHLSNHNEDPAVHQKHSEDPAVHRKNSEDPAVHQ